MTSRTKKFLAMVSACILGVTLLTVAHQVRAQAGARLVAVGGSGGSGTLAVDDHGRIWSTAAGTLIATIPGAIGIYGYSGSGETTVACANGDIYVAQFSSGYMYAPFAFSRNLLSGAPVPATQQSWGQVKERYRK